MDQGFYDFCVEGIRKDGDGRSPKPEFLLLLRDNPERLKYVLTTTNALIEEATKYCLRSGEVVKCEMLSDANYLLEQLPITFRTEIEALPPKVVTA